MTPQRIAKFTKTSLKLFKEKTMKSAEFQLKKAYGQENLKILDTSQ